MMTKRLALEITARMWRWLAKNPGSTKWLAVLSQRLPQDMAHDCACCQFVNEQAELPDSAMPCGNGDALAFNTFGGKEAIKFCPLQKLWPNGCQRKGSPYAIWDNNPKSKRGQKAALQIAAFAERELKRLEREGQINV